MAAPTIVFIGDSYFAGGQIADIEAYFPGYGHTLSGTVGNTSAQVLARFQADAVDLAPDYICVCASINGFFTETEEPADTIANYEAMAALAHAENIKMIYVTGTAITAAAMPVDQNTNTDAFNLLLPDILEAGDILLDWNGEVCIQNSPTEPDTTYYTNASGDFIHLNDLGYARVFALLLNNTTLNPVISDEDVVPAFVQAKEFTNNSGRTSLDLAYNSNVSAGSLLTATIWQFEEAPVPSATDTLGNTWVVSSIIRSGAAGGRCGRMLYASNPVAGACTVSFAWTSSASFVRVIMCEYSNINTFQQTRIGDTTTGTPVSTKAALPNQPNSTIISCGYNNFDLTWSVTTDPTWTLRGPTTYGTCVADQIGVDIIEKVGKLDRSGGASNSRAAFQIFYQLAEVSAGNVSWLGPRPNTR